MNQIIPRDSAYAQASALATALVANLASLPPEEYFAEARGFALAHSPVPYRMQRSFEDGIADLRSLSKCHQIEGSFIFAPETKTWYSLGGKTETDTPGYILHYFNIYDPSRLSAHPLFVHIHPQSCENILAPALSRVKGPNDQARKKKFSAAVPSDVDFALLARFAEESRTPIPLQGRIVTSSGLTSFTAPNDIPAIKAFAGEFRHLSDFRQSSDFMQLRKETLHTMPEIHGETPEQFARRTIDALNEKLPPGFSIRTELYQDTPALILNRPLTGRRPLLAAAQA